MVTTLAEFIRQIITIVIGVTMIAMISTKLLLIMLSSVPVVIIFVIIFGRYVNKLSKKTQDVAADSNNIMTETLTGIKNVKSFGNEFFEMARYGGKADSIRSFAIKKGIASGLFAAFIIFGFLGVITYVIYVGHNMTLTDELSKSEFFTIIFYTAFLVASLTSISGLMANVYQSIGATERLMDLLENETESIAADVVKSKLQGEVRFSNVNFEYSTRKDIPVLKNVSFDVPTGKTVAIVGASGAGKSTITSLLLRFYDVTGGQISVDGKSIMDYDLASLRSQMAIVPQEVMLFAGTIKENIAYGNPEASDSEIIEAADKANASEFINAFPEKMETLVGDRGIQLSGGQKQRIAIARAVLKNPTILILDEATSSLDSESERLVQEALDNLMVNRTSIVIAHRLSTIRKADNILVMNKGELVESGTHNELVEKDGVYAHLSKIQFNG
jgi:ABC-type multidrug transport system fused ATPase/permease subunit